MQVLASQLHFLANRNAELAIPPIFWPVNCIKIGGHVALLSDPGPTVYFLYCAANIQSCYIGHRTENLQINRGIGQHRFGLCKELEITLAEFELLY